MPGAGPPVESRSRRARTLLTTGALAFVLIALVVFALWGTSQTYRAADAQTNALSVDNQLGDTRAAVAVEQMELRSYQMEPSTASYGRYRRAADAAEASLREASAAVSGRAAVDVARLTREQNTFRSVADRLLALVTDQDPSHRTFGRLTVDPAYFTLQQDVNNVARRYHDRAVRLAGDQRRLQSRSLATTVVGIVVGLVLVGAIWRVVLGYQRRLASQADTNEHLAMHDPLTGLPNRALFHRRLETALQQQQDGSRLAVMVIDLNEFKTVNDTLGHPAGDELLSASSQRLRATLPDGDTIARLGGDEFAVLVPAMQDTATATGIARRLTAVLRQDFALAAGSAAISGSAGVAIGSTSSTAESLLRHADAAMYRAKSSGKGVAVYDPRLDVERPERMALFGDLRARLDDGDPDGQLVLHYHPLVSIADARVTAVEALVRWRHPERGLLLPGAFLPIAEDGRLEVPLTYHLLRLALTEAATWQRPERPLQLAVNVSPACLLDEGFVDQVRAAVAGSGLAPALLRLELTENSMVTDPDRAVAALHALRDDGVHISIDDFGTGFSSLYQLKHLTADELKIDRSLTRDVAGGGIDAVLVGSAIDMAHSLNMITTAEGVENKKTLLALRALGCDQAQGHGIARPVPADRLADARDDAERRVRAWCGTGAGTGPPSAGPPAAPRPPAPDRRPDGSFDAAASSLVIDHLPGGRASR